MSPPTRYLEYNSGFFTPLAPFYDWFAIASAPAVRRGLDLAGSLAGARVMDLATGTGAVAFAALRRGASVVGVDACEAMLERARAKVRPGDDLEFRLGSVEEIPASELASADLVTISLGLHDMPPAFRSELLLRLASAPVKRLLVIDYGFPGISWLAWLYTRIVASFETVFFPGFMAAGGIDAHLERAGFRPVAATSLFPGFFRAVLAEPGPQGAS